MRYSLLVRLEKRKSKAGAGIGNPALENAYKNLSSEHSVLFLDETYNAPGEGMDHTFYAIGAVLIFKDALNDARLDLKDITGKSRWHTTDELRTQEGRNTAVSLLKYCKACEEDIYFISLRQPMSEGTPTETARQACLTRLLKFVGEHFNSVRVVVLEKRQDLKHDDADRTLVKNLRSQGTIPRHIQVLLVSPVDEQLLWLPDLLAMAYRRQITHNDETSRYFAEYLEDSTFILEA